MGFGWGKKGEEEGGIYKLLLCSWEFGLVADVWQEEQPCARSEGGHELAPYLKVGNNHLIF